MGAAESKDISFLAFEEDHLKRDENFMISTVEKYGGQALKYAHESLLRDRDFLLKAVKAENKIGHGMNMSGDVVQYADGPLKKSRSFISLAIEENGRCLKFASDELRSDRDIVLRAVRNTPSSLQYALGGLNQDKELLKAAKLWNTDYDEIMSQLPLSSQMRAVMSTRFSLGEDSSPQATIFGVLLREHFDFRKNAYLIYHPNAWNKASCDKDWTNYRHPCRGTFQTCRMKNSGMKSGIPKEEESCWRYSYRFQLENAKKAKVGFMIQLVEGDKERPSCHMLGDGQFIEVEMASMVGLKIFQVFQPFDDNGYDKDYTMQDVHNLSVAIEAWLDHDCVDMSITHVGNFIDDNSEIQSNVNQIPSILKKIRE